MTPHIITYLYSWDDLFDFGSDLAGNYYVRYSKVDNHPWSLVNLADFYTLLFNNFGEGK